MRIWNRKIGLILLAVVVVILLVYAFLPKPVPVDVARTKRAPMRVTLVQEGRTRVKDAYLISAPVAGFARRIEFDVGDPVKEGQVLLVLEPPRPEFLSPRNRAEAEAAVRAARASLNAAEANARARAAETSYAEARYERLKRLFQTGAVSRNELDIAESEYRASSATLNAAQDRVKVARSELEQAQAVLKYSAAREAPPSPEIVAIRSPAGGRVLTIHHESAGMVNAGEPLIEIGDPGNLEVAVDVLSTDAVRIEPGMAVIFERWGGIRPLYGRVRYIEPEAFTKVSALGVEEQRVWVIVDFSSPRELWEELGNGYRLDANFILWQGQNVLQVHEGALFRYKNGWAVFIVKNNRAQLRRVQVGYRSGLSAQIISGLTEGELVIVHPSDEIEDGVRVRVR